MKTDARDMWPIVYIVVIYSTHYQIC